MGDTSKPFYDLATIVDPPYVKSKEDVADKYEGFVVDLLDSVSQSTQGSFDYKLKVINGTYGHLESNGQWSGLIGSVSALPADMAVGAIAITNERNRVVQFTEVFHRSSIQLLMPRPIPEAGPGATLLLAPFTAGSWVLLLLAFLLVSAGFFLIGRFSPFEWIRVSPENDVRRARYSFGLRNSFLFAISTLTWQGYKEAPKSLSGRTLAASWWVFVLLVLVAYTSNLTALVSSRPHLQPTLSFRNYEDLLRDGKVDVGMIRNGDADLTLRHSEYSLAKQMYEYVSNRHNWVNDLEAGLERMRNSKGTFALLLPEYKARHLASKECDLITYGHGLGIIEYAFAVPKGMSNLETIRRRINSALMTMKTTGDLSRLQKKWDGKGGKCSDPEGSSLPVRRSDSGVTFVALSPRDLAVPLLWLFLCFIITGGVAALEILYTKGYLKNLPFHKRGQRDEEAGEAGEPLKSKSKAGTSAADATADIEEEDENSKEKDRDNDDNRSGDQDELEPEDKAEKEEKEKGLEEVVLSTDDDKAAGGEGK